MIIEWMSLCLFLITLCTDAIVKGLLNSSNKLIWRSTAKCPLNMTTFEKASRNMNCSGNTRYLCAPNKDLSSLIEFCTTAKRGLYGPDNCVKHQSNGYLDHVPCNSSFKDGCPDTSYYDDEVFKFQSCLRINTILKCFVKDRNCVATERSTSNPNLQNITKDVSSDSDERSGDIRLLGLLAILPLILAIFVYYRCCRRDIKRKSDPETEETLLQETDGKEREKLTYRKEKPNERSLWRTPYREKLDELPLNLLTVFYSILFTKTNQIDDGSDNCWLIVLNKVRHVFELDDITEEKARIYAKTVFNMFHSISEGDLEVPDDLYFEIFWSFFRQSKFEGCGRLDFFLENASKETIAQFCRTSGYQKVSLERCMQLPVDYTDKLIEKLGQKILTHPTVQDPLIHEKLSKKFDIPVEVLKWGKDGIQRFIAYLDNGGKEPVYHTKGMIVGCAGAGKTTLLKRLKDCSIAEILKTEPTKGLDVHTDVFKVEGNALKVNKNQSVKYFNIPQDRIQCVQLPILKQKAHPNPSVHEEEINTSIDIPKETIQSKSEIHHDPQMENSTLQTSLISESHEITELGQIKLDEKWPGSPVSEKSFENPINVEVHDEETYDPFLQTLRNVAFHGERSVQLITLLDFAGQSAYYACHQIYFSARAFYILVIDMSKDLNAVVGEDVCDHSETVFETWRYRDFYAFWMKSIHTYSSPNAPVIIVATHAEDKCQDDIEKFEKELFEIFGYDLVSKHLVKDKIITLTLPRDNTCQPASVEDLKIDIRKTVEKQPYWGEDLPSSWVVFENEIRKRKETSKIMKIQDLHKLCRQMSEHIRIDIKELKDALRFFHEIGTILYFDSAELEDTVILDVQWFVNAFKNIITDNQDLQLQNIKFALWKKCNQTGELDDTLLEEIWKRTEDSRDSFFKHKSELLSYMQHLGLLARGSEETKYVHLIPCMTKRKISHSDIAKCHKNFVFSFQFDFFPNFIFWRFLVTCVCSYGWSILEESGQKYIFRNSCFLSYEEVDVAIKINDNILDVQILESDDSPVGQNLKIDILRRMEEILQILTRPFPTNITFTIGCRCKVTKVFEIGNSRFLSVGELLKIKDTRTKVCSACGIEKHQVPVENLLEILEGRTESHGYRQTKGISITGKRERRRGKSEKEDQDLEFGVDDVRHLKTLKGACLRGNKQQFDHEIQKHFGEKQLLFTRDSDGYSLLHFACEGGNLEILKHLLEEGFMLDSTTFKGKTVLHIASQFGHKSICDYVLSKDTALLEITDKRKGNAAHFAAEGGYVEILEFLVNKGINPKQLTERERNIFHIASSNDQQEMCKYIVQTYPEIIHSVDGLGWNALHFATAKGHIEMFDTLVGFDLDVKSKTNRGNSVLHIACLKSRLEMCKYIINRWPYLVKEQNKLNRTPVFAAVEGGDINILKLLKNYDADERAIAADNHTLLHVASEHSNYEICKYVIQTYPEMTNLSSSKNFNALHMLAAGSSRSEEEEIMVFNLLVSHGVDIFQTTKKGSSVLSLACKNRKYDLCKYMVDHHPALLKIPSVDLLKTAEETNDKEMIELFKMELNIMT
ncbi:uncharacterized protein LOC133187361 [Saccostrea echinata]|uniref:uncharacterized protein LOC133187361 n=1 Tax=Saccostrea echinata TaxID=191078 RepID=UPI002A7FE71C|nr:uncharacterized protein LOC133187361 [Saccostrea echinata]